MKQFAGHRVVTPVVIAMTLALCGPAASAATAAAVAAPASTGAAAVRSEGDAAILASSGVIVGPRPTMHAFRVPDGFIHIDGRDDDWRRLGGVVDRDCVAAGGNAHILAPIPARGNVTGGDDLSMIVTAAYDSANVYVIADVHDSVLLNYGDAQTPWVGDDFELYFDANPADKQYADSIDDDDGHYTFVPPNINLSLPGGLVYPNGKIAGVKYATRLRPFGYTIECAIPKDLLPNWKAHPDMPSVGFDAQVSDADAPGMIGHDPADKAILYLLKPDFHYRTSRALGSLIFDTETITPTREAGRVSTRSIKQIMQALARDDSGDPAALAQDILDRIDDPAIGNVVAAASRSNHPSILRAAALIYARRPLLSIPADGFANLVPNTDGEAAEMSPTGQLSVTPYKYADPDDSYFAYALLALSERRQLKPAPLFYQYLMLPDAALRLNFLWCLGINGDKSIVPKLAAAYSTSTGQDKLVIAWSLAMLGDRTGAATLDDAVKTDPKSAFGTDAARLLKQFGM